MLNECDWYMVMNRSGEERMETAENVHAEDHHCSRCSERKLHTPYTYNKKRYLNGELVADIPTSLD
jgi:hypothetical protein